MPSSLALGRAAIFLMAVASAYVGAETPGATVSVLPAPAVDGGRSFEATLASRASVRNFSGSTISLADAGQLLWAAQGISHDGHKRTVPSAGALYPLEIYLIAAAVEGIPPGAYRYKPKARSLELVKPGNQLAEVAAAAGGQDPVRNAAAVLLLTAIAERSAAKYGERAQRYVYIEAGHAAQNALLQAVARGLGAVPVGAFDEAALSRLFSLARREKPVYMIAVGRPAS